MYDIFKYKLIHSNPSQSFSGQKNLRHDQIWHRKKLSLFIGKIARNHMFLRGKFSNHTMEIFLMTKKNVNSWTCKRPLFRNCSNISGTWVLSGRPHRRGSNELPWLKKKRLEVGRHEKSVHCIGEEIHVCDCLWWVGLSLGLGYMFGIKDFGHSTIRVNPFEP